MGERSPEMERALEEASAMGSENLEKRVNDRLAQSENPRVQEILKNQRASAEQRVKAESEAQQDRVVMARLERDPEMMRIVSESLRTSHEWVGDLFRKANWSWRESSDIEWNTRTMPEFLLKKLLEPVESGTSEEDNK